MAFRHNINQLKTKKMNREIKFRVFDNLSKKMNPVNSIWGFPELENITIPFEDTVETLFNNFELMQFTGIKDKYGKDIYEGDLCNTEDGVCEIVFKYGCFCYLISKEETFCPSFNWHIEELEIVGNIFENPEMLLVSQAIT